jgi:hypothetical protein
VAVTRRRRDALPFASLIVGFSIYKQVGDSKATTVMVSGSPIVVDNDRVGGGN